MHICRDVQKDAYVLYVTAYVHRVFASVHLMKGREMSSETSYVSLFLHRVHYYLRLITNFSIHTIYSAFFLVQGQTQSPFYMKCAGYC